MKAFVVVATKGRPKETHTLLDYLAAQTFLIEKIVIVGSEAADVNGLATHPLAARQKITIKTSEAGSCIQRNVGLDEVSELTKNLDARDWFVVFFDDDFRPAKDWTENCANFFINNIQAAGLGGWVLADGAVTGCLGETDAVQYLTQAHNQAVPNWLKTPRAADSLYGCNMAYRGSVASTVRFDENLPLYAWQEDIDFGARAKTFGKLYYIKDCVGVHLGASSGRTSGVRFGYSQIANPIYLVKKGTMTKPFANKLMRRNMAANIFNTLILKRDKDYFGRLRGNVKAGWHLLIGKCHPTNIIDI